jgi:hypothetical protein
MVITAVPTIDPMDPTPKAPFYAIYRTCYVVDFPAFDIKFLNKSNPSGALFHELYGGFLHELGHCLNMDHSRETNSEDVDESKGSNLMFAGNYKFGNRTTFINRAGCAVLNNCQLFAAAEGQKYYDGHTSCITSLNAQYVNGNIVVSGTFEYDHPVTAVNFYQDPDETPESLGYHRIAWSVNPVGNTFSVSMPVKEMKKTDEPEKLITMDGAFKLQVELVFQNGEVAIYSYPFSYKKGIPAINLNLVLPTFRDQPKAQATCERAAATFTANATGTGNTYQWQYWEGTQWYDIESGTTDFPTHWKFVANQGSLLITPYENNDVQKVRVIVSNNTCPITSDEASLFVTSLTINTQPTAQSSCIGSIATFTVGACGSGNTYQWQYYQGSDWIPVPVGTVTTLGNSTLVATTDALRLMPSANNDVQKVRVKVTNTTGSITSNEVLFTVNSPGTITQQPTNLITSVGKTATFTAAATGAGTTYQWQYWQGTAWGNIGAGTTSIAGSATFNATNGSLQVTPVANTNVQKVRVIVSKGGACPVTSSEATLTVTSTTPITFTKQPTAQSACVGTTATFTAVATGTNTSYQWAFGLADGSWSTLAANAASLSNPPYWTVVATNGSFQITPGPSNNIQKVRVMVTNSTGSITSNEVLFTVRSPGTITQQPTNLITSVGKTATFTAAATGAGITYQWQYWQGTAWGNIGAGTTSIAGSATFNATNGSLQVTPVANTNVQKVRVIVSKGGACPITSSEATLTVTSTTPITFTKQPTAQSACVGTTATFTAVATGTNTSYQWAFGLADGSWSTLAANAASLSNPPYWTVVATNGSFQITPGPSNNIQKVRVMVTNSTGSITSNEVLFTVNSPGTITQQPTNLITSVGKTATFTAAATGAGITYQWQYWQGTAWGNIGAGTTSIAGSATFNATNGSLQVTPVANTNVQKVRVIVSKGGACPITSSEATLTVTSTTPITFTKQPTAQSACVGTTATFTAVATGTNTSYQWAFGLADGSWSTLAANAASLSNPPYWTVVATNGSFQITPGPSNNIQKVRVMVTNSTGSITSNEVLFTVRSPGTITQQPTNLITSVGKTATFTAAATGAGITYQWQYWQGTAWGNIGAGTTSIAGSATFNATNGSLQVTPVANTNVQKVRVIVSKGGACPITSSEATLTVTSTTPITFTKQPTAQSACVGTTATFTAVATGTNTSYQWAFGLADGSWSTLAANAASLSNPPYWTVVATNGSFQITPGPSNNIQKVRVMVTNSTGSITSNEVLFTVRSPGTITQQPTNLITSVGKTATFTAAATGAGTTYQWQYWQGTAWGNIGAGTTSIAGSATFNATNGSLQVTPVANTNVQKVRVIVSKGGACPITSSEATLTINPKSTQSSPQAFSTARVSTIFSAEILLQVSPNPTDGPMTVSFNGSQRGPLTLGVRTVSGVEVLLQHHQKTEAVFQQMIDLKSAPGGIYFVEVKIGEQVFRKRVLKP